MTNSSDIKASAVTRAVALLHAAGAQFKVIYGTVEYGELKVAPPALVRTPKRNNPKYPHGERTAYIKALLSDMKIGDVRTVPFTAYSREDLQGVVAPTCVDMWGKSAYQTQVRHDGVDVLRVL
jgi:hypothetical protein